MLQVLLIFGLMVLNGLFAAAEIAVLSVRKTRLAEFVRRGDRRALAVQRLHNQPERFLATVQIGLTVVGTAAAAFGGHGVAVMLEAPLRRAGLGDGAEEAAFVIVVAGISFFELIIGELVPKSLALRYADRYSFFVARPLLVASRVMAPLV